MVEEHIIVQTARKLWVNKMLVCVTGKCGTGKTTAMNYIKKQGKSV